MVGNAHIAGWNGRLLNAPPAATTDAGRSSLLAFTRFGTPGAHPGSGGYLSLFLAAVAGLITSLAMLPGTLFSQTTAIVGNIAGGLDPAYCIGYAFLPGVDSELISVILIPAAGLFLMIWHTMFGRTLYQLGRLKGKS